MTEQAMDAVPAQARHRSLGWLIAIAGLTMAAATLIPAGQSAGAANTPQDPNPPVVTSSQPVAGAAGPSPAGVTAWPPLDTAAPFFLADVRDKIDGRWGASWLSLYPLHQQLVSQADFVLCETETPFSAPLHAVHVLSVKQSPVHVPGLTLPVPGVALDVRLEIAAGYGPRDPIELRHTFHLVPVNGRWTWILSLSRYQLYRDHDC